MLNLFRTLTFSAMLISFSTSVLALPPPSGDEADPKNNGKREKSDKAPQKPAKKRKANTTTIPNPNTPLPHAPVIPAASLSSLSYFVPAAAQSMFFSEHSSEKEEKRQPLQTIEVDDDLTEMKMVTDSRLPIKSGPNSHHPIVQKIGEVLIKHLDPQRCKIYEDLIQEELEKYVERKKEKSKNLFLKFFEQNLSQLNLKPEKCEVVRESILISLLAGQKEEFENEDASEMPGILDAALDKYINNTLLNECKARISQLFPSLQDKSSSVKPVLRLEQKKTKQINIAAHSSLAASLPAQASLTAVHLAQLNFITSQDDLSSVIQLIKSREGNFIIPIKGFDLKIKFQEGTEEKAFEDLLYFLEHNDVNQLTHFALFNNELGIEKAIRLLNLMKKCVNLENLFLTDANIGESGILFLSEHVLPHLKMLKRLRLSNNNGGPNAMLEFFRALEKSACFNNLTDLYIGQNNAGKLAILELAKLIQKKRNLLILEVDNNYCGSEAALRLAEALAHNQRLIFVDLSSNDINLETMKNILVHLSHAKRLGVIYLTTRREFKIKKELKDFLKAQYPEMVMLLKTP